MSSSSIIGKNNRMSKIIKISEILKLLKNPHFVEVGLGNMETAYTEEDIVKLLKIYGDQIIDNIADRFDDRHDEEVADEIRCVKKEIK